MVARTPLSLFEDWESSLEQIRVNVVHPFAAWLRHADVARAVLGALAVSLNNRVRDSARSAGDARRREAAWAAIDILRGRLGDPVRLPSTSIPFDVMVVGFEDGMALYVNGYLSAVCRAYPGACAVMEELVRDAHYGHVRIEWVSAPGRSVQAPLPERFSQLLLESANDAESAA